MDKHSEEKRNNRGKKFWNRYAGLYDAEVLRFSGKAYEEMYKKMGDAFTPDMRVLEIATGTGLISIHVAKYVHSIEATDYSPKMIAVAQKKKSPDNVRFSVEDGTNLSYADNSFDAVIISNALHIMPDPDAVLDNIRRVLKPGGLLIAPTFSHGHGTGGKLNTFILKLVGFETYSKWTPEEFVAMIGRSGFTVKTWCVLDAAFPLVYLEAGLG